MALWIDQKEIQRTIDPFYIRQLTSKTRLNALTRGITKIKINELNQGNFLFTPNRLTDFEQKEIELYNVYKKAQLMPSEQLEIPIQWPPPKVKPFITTKTHWKKKTKSTPLETTKVLPKWLRSNNSKL